METIVFQREIATETWQKAMAATLVATALRAVPSLHVCAFPVETAHRTVATSSDKEDCARDFSR